MKNWSKLNFADDMGLLSGNMRYQDDLNEIRSQWEGIRQINFSHSWPYCTLCRYLVSKKISLKEKTGVE